MAEMKIEPMDAAAFLEWCTHQEEAYELVDGVPRLMVGARSAHDNVVVNGLTTLRQKLKGGPCRPFTEALAIKIPNGNVRRPDITVDCGTNDPDRLHLDRPVLVIEVLSRSTRQIDLVRKLAEYQRVPTIEYILIIEPDEISGVLHTRQGADAWSTLLLVGGETEIPLPVLGISLNLSDFYE